MSEKNKVSFSTINEKIADGIEKNANTNAVDRIVEKRVEAEVTRRADLLEKALDKYNSAKKDLAKCKPDLISNVILDEVPVKHEAWSNQALEAKKKKIQKLIADLDIAILNAMSQGDYKKLQELTAGGGQKPGKEKENEPAD